MNTCYYKYFDLEDSEWEVIEPLLPVEKGHQGRPTHSNRRYINGFLYVMQTGCTWRELPDQYGEWNSVYRRYDRWCKNGLIEKMCLVAIQEFEKDKVLQFTTLRAKALKKVG